MALTRSYISQFIPTWHQPYKTNAPRRFYDVIISSDVLEHVHHPDLYLAEANSMCVNGGILLLSTPNGLASRGDPNIIKVHSPFHIAEYARFELQKLLQRAGSRLLLIIVAELSTVIFEPK
jgi:2-polyprenyl-3-methyl-5-hydroxy-6-metoxy-1,4-benzoquinol methylase